jgi:hypothetical protein
MRSSARTSYVLVFAFVLWGLFGTTFHQVTLLQGTAGQFSVIIAWGLLLGVLGTGVYMADVPTPPRTMWVWRVGLVGYGLGWLLEGFGVGWGAGFAFVGLSADRNCLLFLACQSF